MGDLFTPRELCEERAKQTAIDLMESARVLAGLTKTELARRLGMHRTGLQSRLSGESPVTLRAFAETLDICGYMPVVYSLQLEDGPGVGSPPVTIDEDAVDLMERARHYAGITKRELAQRIGVGKSTIMRRLSGESPVTPEKLAVTLDACGCVLVIHIFRTRYLST